MINIPNVTIKSAADLSPEWWETAEQIIKAQICVQRHYLMDRPLTLHCSEHTIICTDDQTGDFRCQIFMPDSYENGSQIVRDALSDDINNLPEKSCCLFYIYADGIDLIDGSVDLTLSVDVSEESATVNFSLRDGSSVTLDFDAVESFAVDCKDPGTADKTWTFDLESGVQVVLSSDAQ